MPEDKIETVEVTVSFVPVFNVVMDGPELELPLKKLLPGGQIYYGSVRFELDVLKGLSTDAIERTICQESDYLVKELLEKTKKELILDLVERIKTALIVAENENAESGY